MKKPVTPHKNLLCICLMLFMYDATQAQFTKGTKLLGGSLLYRRTQQKYSNSTVDETMYHNFLEFKPSLGYFITKKVVIGGGVGLNAGGSHSKDKNYKTKNTGVSIYPFVRYYIHPKLYLLAETGVAKSKTKDFIMPDNTTFTYHYSNRYWNLAVGYVKFLNESIAIETQVGYNSGQYKYGNGSASTTSQNLGLFIRIGLQLYLRKLQRE